MRKNKELNFVIAIFFIAIFWGEAVVNTQFRICGIVVTAYRSVMILCFLLSFIVIKREQIKMSQLQIGMLLILYFWICVALLQIFFNTKLELKEGLKEIVYIIFGFCICWCVYVYIKDFEHLKQTYKCLKYITIMLILMGVLESILGVHWPISKFNDTVAMQFEMERWGTTQESYKWISTGPFYNENDFSAVLTILMPFLFYDNSNIKRKIVAMLSFGGIVVIVILNGSLISIGGIAFYCAYKIWKKSSLHIKVAEIISIFVALMAVCINCGALIDYIKNTSLFIRLELYVESLKLSLNNIFLGIGPGAFEQYFELYPLKAGITNPHNYFIEILSQYGLITLGLLIFLFIIFFYILMLNKKIYEAEIMIEVLLVYTISSFAPSSFIDKSFSWLPMALIPALIKCIYEDKYVKKNI